MSRDEEQFTLSVSRKLGKAPRALGYWKRIMAKGEHSLLLSRKRIYRLLRPCEAASRSRVFVAGMQRSGTNMLMDVLEKSLDTDVFHERDSRAFDDYQMRNAGTIQCLINNSRAKLFVIKALCELQDLPDLMGRFAPAKAIWIVRDYNDVVNSMMRSFRNMAKQVHRIAIERNSDGWLGRGMSDETHEIVKQMAAVGLNDATASALQWYFRNMIFFEQKFDRNERVLLVAYERLVSAPEEEFRRIFDFIDIDFSVVVVRSVSPSSIGKHSAPEISPAVRDLCDGLLHRFHAVIEG